MKGNMRFFGIAVILAALAFAGCDNGTTTTPEPVVVEYTVTFNANNGTENTSQKVIEGGKITAPSPEPARENYGFGGWYRDDESFEEAWNFETDTVSGNITLYAKWVPDNGAVTPEGMVLVEGGVFRMGNTDTSVGWDTERPVHEVTISSFYIGKYEVTQAEYEEVMGSNPSYFQGETRLPAEGEEQGKRPVERVSWYDAVEYCNALSVKEGLTPYYTINKTVGSDTNNRSSYDEYKWLVTVNPSANGYRLPTEAEWEYAAKGGNGSPGNYEYSGSNSVAEVAWYGENSGGKTHEVGKKRANGLGIYDMSGNVWEWCWDWYGLYTAEAQNNPTGVSVGDRRVRRGGGWYLPDPEYRPVEYERSTFRLRDFPLNWNYSLGYVGFRVARRPRF